MQALADIFIVFNSCDARCLATTVTDQLCLLITKAFYANKFWRRYVRSF